MGQEEELVPETADQCETTPREEKVKEKESSLEFKIGVGALSGIGLLFVIAAVAIMIRNFVPSVIQGMILFSFFAVLWLASQMGVSKVFPKLALGLSGASVMGLYLAIVWNYYIFDILPREWAVGLLILVGLVSGCVGIVMQSAVFQCLSFGGYLLFSLCLPWGTGRGAVLCAIGALVLMNLLWHILAAGKQKSVVRLVHIICYVTHILIYEMGMLIWQPKDGLIMVMLYGVAAAVLLNVFLLLDQGIASLGSWICGAVFQTSFLLGVGVSFYFGGRETEPLLLLALLAANLILLILKKFQPRFLGLYIQSIFLVLILAAGGLRWPEGIASLLLFGMGLYWIQEGRLFHELGVTIYFCLFLPLLVPREASAIAVFAFLLGFTFVCLKIPRMRCEREAALVYTNVSLMGAVLLSVAHHRFLGDGTMVTDAALWLLAVLAVLMLWRERFHLPGRLRGLMLAAVSTYMLLVGNISSPVAASIALLGVALAGIVVGFWKNMRPLRIYGLCLALFVCAKVVLYDFWDLDLFAKGLLLLGVGLAAIAISIIYAIIEYYKKGSP